MIAWLRRLLESLFGPREELDTTMRASPLEYYPDGEAALDICIYQSVAVTKRNGRTPAKVVARFLHQNLKGYGYAHKIRYEFNSIEFRHEYEKTNPDREAVDWWSSTRVGKGEDANLLILDIGGGGISYQDLRYGVGPGKHIDKMITWSEDATTDDPIWRNVRACMHEVGHMIGGDHAEAMFNGDSMVFSHGAIDEIDKYIRENKLKGKIKGGEN